MDDERMASGSALHLVDRGNRISLARVGAQTKDGLGRKRHHLARTQRERGLLDRDRRGPCNRIDAIQSTIQSPM